MRGGLGLTQRGLRWFSRRGNGQLLFMGLVAWAAISASFVVIVLAATGSGLLGPSAAHASFVLRRRVASGGVRALFFGDEYKSSRDMARGKRIRARDAAVQTLIDEERERRRRATEDASSDGGRESRLSYFPGQYAGVIVDAARQPFSLADLREIVDFLSKIDVLNVLHLRLSDDQGFVLALDTHPELASVYWDSGAANGTMASGVYTANEMRAFVQYAKKKGVFIVPELDVPGHAGGWWRSGLLVDCPKYACKNGWSIPLDVARPEAVQLVAEVFAEIRDIFSNAPFYHLGGDEVRLSDPCWAEALKSEILVENSFLSSTHSGSSDEENNDARKKVLRVPTLSQDDLSKMEQQYAAARRKVGRHHATFEAKLEALSPGVHLDRVMRFERGFMNAAAQKSRFGRAVHFWMSSPEEALETEAEEALLITDRKWMKTRRRQAVERQRRRGRIRTGTGENVGSRLPPSRSTLSFWDRLWAKKKDSGASKRSGGHAGVAASDEDILDSLISPPFFISTGLYFDRPNGGDSGFEVYQRTVEFLLQGATGVIAGTFELDRRSWGERNVWGKLVAIAVAVRQSMSIITNHENNTLGLSESVFRKEYAKLCLGDAGLGREVCALFGEPAVPNAEWLARYEKEMDPSVCMRLPVCHAVTQSLSVSELSALEPVPISEDLRIMRLGAANGTTVRISRRAKMAFMYELHLEAEKEHGMD
jgi:hypothetical protein